MSSPGKRQVTVVGAGIVGLACASNLLRDGCDVVLVDRGLPGEGTSCGNGGLLAPGSVVPIAMPGTLKEVPKWLLDPDAPLAVQWRYFPAALPWLMRFIGESTLEKAYRSARAQRAITGTTFSAYDPLLRWAGATHLVRRTGYAYIYEAEGTFQKSQAAWRLRHEMGVKSELLTGDQFREMEPAFNRTFARVMLMPEEGYCTNPLDLCRSLAHKFLQDGGKFVQRTVTGFKIGPGGPVSLTTDAGDLSVGAVVIAAGAYSKPLAAELGSAVPLESLRGYNITISNPGPRPKIPVMVADRKFGITPMEPDLLRVSGIAEIAGLNAPPTERRRDYFLKEVSRLIDGIDSCDTSFWLGHRPSLPDSVPVISRSPKYQNVFFAFGHGIAGLTGASTTGLLVSQLVRGAKPDIDMDPYRVDRF